MYYIYYQYNLIFFLKLNSSSYLNNFGIGYQPKHYFFKEAIIWLFLKERVVYPNSMEIVYQQSFIFFTLMNTFYDYIFYLLNIIKLKFNVYLMYI